MKHVHWTSRPALRRPLVLVAFAGWNDAGDAATTATRWCRDRWAPTPFATLDPEDFFDFTTTRPEIRLDDGHRRIEWPSTEATSGSLAGRDIVVLLGSEPQLRWRTFAEEIVELATAVDAELIVTLGALLAEVPHTRPTSVLATSEVGTLDLPPSTYEGPTGIVGVIHDACRRGGLPSASLWAAVSAYVPGAPSPKAALALVEHVGDLFDLPVMATELEIASAAYERQVSEVVADDEEMHDYVADLEIRYDADDGVPSPASLVEEVERFLRGQPPS
jgi:hypothetical protein